jgi:hypothetical protein
MVSHSNLIQSQLLPHRHVTLSLYEESHLLSPDEIPVADVGPLRQHPRHEYIVHPEYSAVAVVVHLQQTGSVRADRHNLSSLG